MISFPHTQTVAFAAVLLAFSAAAAAHVAPDSCGLPDSTKPSTYLATDHDGEGVNIRAQPNARAAILAVCDNQGEAAILGKSGAWYRVQLALRPNQPQERRLISGYVHQSQASLRHTYIVRSADGSANLRLQANSRAEVQERLPNGTVVTEYPARRQGDWHYVSLDGSDSELFGYVHKSQIRPKAGR
ncbi:hypothetical protein H9Q10_05830 [Eikenella sp. S3360]|uniref:SH3 domain-containing protein n=1 Tax=Eikenella glucosivorans TaxID=2766967 RepID=A0ABS0NA71_9NEIS|nr:SH3 domain-containing protein [Eikenella glucosivorans]MBH5329186.1 hypothetical protein [Eikenella glucosivorans]